MRFLRKVFCVISVTFFVLFVSLMGLSIWVKKRLPLVNKIAIIRIEGVITTADDIVKLIKKAGEDKSIKAVVLRVNSPGGAVGATQEIYKELLRLKKEFRKPLVVSMENVAASGGLYVSLPADVIYANGGTITGSIGVIIQKMNIEGLMKKLGVQAEIVKTGKFKDILSPFREMKEEEKKLLAQLEENVLEQFKQAVVENRKGKLKVDIDSIADGRIFTGLQAKEIGLVDKIGNLEDAIKEAEKLANLTKSATVIELKKEEPFLRKFLGNNLENIKNSLSTPLMFYYLLR